MSWILLGVTFVISFIPFLGCGTWILAWPVAVAAIIMGIIVLTCGGTGQGILIIIAAVLIVPLTFLGQFASLAIFGGHRRSRAQRRSWAARDRKREKSVSSL